MTTAAQPQLTPAIEFKPVEALELDPQNPRLPEELLGSSDADMLEWLEATSTLEELASSMLANGFFDHEPLVVKSESGAAPFTVVEGNRRYATLSILLQLPAAVEAGLQFPYDVEPEDWQLDRLRIVPCLVVKTDAEVRKYLGFRHIGGVKTWGAEAKARYLEREVDEAVATGSPNPFRDVGKRVGTNAVGVRGPYIALKVLKVARDELSMRAEANEILRRRFGVWNRLLNSGEVRRFIGLGEGLDYDSVSDRLRNLNSENLGMVLRDLLPEPGSRLALLQDSRDATSYGRVIANSAARAALVRYRDLELAVQIADEGTLPARLLTLTRSIDLLTQSIDSFAIGKEENEAALRLANAARSLQVIVKDRFDDPA